LIAKTLLDIETLEADEFIALIEGREPEAPAASPTPPTTEASEDEQDEQVEWKPPSSIDLPPAPTPA
jgi:hypothetical protein